MKNHRTPNGQTSSRLVVLYNRLGPRCVWCGVWTKLPPKGGHIGRVPDDAATREHLVPAACGGTNHPDNLAIACYRCNTSRRTALVRHNPDNTDA